MDANQDKEFFMRLRSRLQFALADLVATRLDETSGGTSMKRKTLRIRTLCSTLSATSLCLLLLSTTAAHAQETRWVTIGEYRRIQITEAIQAAAEAARGKREFNQQITAARNAYLANRRDPAAEKRFADLLGAKDHYYFAQMLAEGTSEYSQKRVAGLNLITGGAMDEGIAPPAEPLFLAWVDKVRATLGATDRRQMLILTDTKRVDAAIRQHEDEYKRYRIARDAFETDRADMSEKVAKARAALTPEVKVKLDAQETANFNRGSDLTGKGVVPQPLSMLAASIGADPVLRCRYGPTAIYEDGRPEYEHFRFWQDKPPAQIDELINANTNGHLGELATRTALAVCPPTAVAARSATVRVGAPAVQIAAGEYAMEGTSVFGRGYSGQCTITPEADGRYTFRCKGRAGMEGSGVAVGNIVTVEYQGFVRVVYEVGSDGRLNGTWDTGSERLTPARSASAQSTTAAAPTPSRAPAPIPTTDAPRDRHAERRCEFVRQQIDLYQKSNRATPSREVRLAALLAQYAQNCGG